MQDVTDAVSQLTATTMRRAGTALVMPGARDRRRAFADPYEGGGPA